MTLLRNLQDRLTPRTMRLVDAIAIFALTAWIGIDLLGTHFFDRKRWPDSAVDFRIIYDYSRHVVKTGDYPAVFPHPPAAVALEFGISQLPYPVAAGIWLLLTGAAALACWAALARMLRLDRKPGGMALVLAAQAATAYFVQWELRSLNNNLQFLAALIFAAKALDERAPRRAGLWLALSISLKLYSALIVPYLVLTGRRKELASTLIGLAALWLVMPLAVFGVDTANVYAAWLRQIAGAIAADRELHPILISLSGSAAWLPAGEAIAWLIRGLWFATLAAVGIHAIILNTSDKCTYRLLADISILTLAPIAVSPYLEPYHAVPYAIPAITLAAIAADASFSQRNRRTAVALLAVSASMVYWPLGWELRGLMVNIQLLVATVGAAVVAFTRVSTIEAPTVPSVRARFRETPGTIRKRPSSRTSCVDRAL